MAGGECSRQKHSQGWRKHGFCRFGPGNTPGWRPGHPPALWERAQTVWEQNPTGNHRPRDLSAYLPHALEGTCRNVQILLGIRSTPNPNISPLP